MAPDFLPGSADRSGTDGGLLSHLLVIDLGSWIAGPSAATVMADFGAEVIKIEPPGAGDPFRALGDLPGMPTSEHNYSWLLDARNKQSVALDLKVPEAREALLALVARADVLVTNYPPAVLRRLGIEWADLEPVNPRLVYAWLTGYGDRGEEAGKPGFDVNAWWARSGLMDLVRADGCPPTSSMPGMGDHPTGIAVFGAIMLGLYRRERTGAGGVVSTSLMANGVWTNSVLIQAMLCGARFHDKRPRERALNPLANVYRRRDDRWLILTLLRPDREWAAFARAVERPELATDPRFATPAARQEHAPVLIAILDEVLARRDYAEWARVLTEHGVTFGPVARLDAILEDRQMAQTGTIVATGPDIPGGRMVMSPIDVAGEVKATPRRAPEVGEHTLAVLERLGYDAAAITRLRAAGALG